MQLILTHADLELALIESLRSKGMTAFEPGKASVEFTFKRGTKELQCVLDTEPKAVVEKPQGEAPVAVATAPVAEVIAQASETADPVQEPEAPAAEVAAEVAPAGGDDNLFD